ncbi:hypothetical protein D0T84_18065 [Dysgonomonas sp. 521]|uniref:DUF6080 domain-containing protein n=1 Tax=Dysgonomonas sp. 521 TaxID=2302932 RepID=UPI0013D23F5E|nr:DUF6080 domain-containing protein [Dysgonomonas sp. 521]NDV96798.1 hypothetical protein [Dysgonomonas sp. 521]
MGKITSLIDDIKCFLKTLLPQKKEEKYLFVILLLFYFLYSVYIVFSTSIVDNTTIETDIYFSYDNPLILEHGRTQISGHPLLMVFYYPFVLIGNALAYLITFKAKTLFFVLLSSSMISMSCVYVYRYLREIADIEKPVSYLLTLFFAFFSTNLILCFTPESFTLSALFLAFNVYYNSSYIKKKESPPFVSNIVLADFILGGITITNVAKGIAPVLFFKEKKMSVLKKIVLLSLIFLAILCVVHIFSAVFLNKNYFESIFIHRESFTDMSLSGTPYFRMLFIHFFGAPVFFSHMMNYEAQGTGLMYIIEGDYLFWWQYLYATVVLVLMLFSLISNYKNAFVQMIFLLVLVDIVIHCFLKFGMDQPFIYGAHWIYCVPLLFGWLYKKLKGFPAKAFVVLILCLFVGLVINNLYRLSEFINLAQRLYPAN